MNLYGWVLLLAGVAHFPWVRTLVSLHGRQSRFAIATGLPLNEWSHIAGTYDGKSIRLYINGELGAETCYESAPLELTKSDFWLGNHRQNTRPYAGYLKDIHQNTWMNRREPVTFRSVSMALPGSFRWFYGQILSCR